MHRLCAIILLMTVLLTPWAKADVVVIMRRVATAPGKYVRVGDIARVDGPGDQAREVALTVLGPAPVRGEVQRFSRSDVESRLFEMGVLGSVSFSGNDSVMVRGDGAPALRREQDIVLADLLPIPGGDSRVTEKPAAAARPPAAPATHGEEATAALATEQTALLSDAKARVRQEIENYFADRYRSGASGRSDIEVEADIVSANAAIPYSAYEIAVTQAEGRVPGKATLRLAVRDTASSSPRDVDVVAETTVFGKALVAARNIPRGEAFDSRDATVSRVRMEAGAGYLPPNPASLVGREAKRPLKPGDVILAADAPVGITVKRGDMLVMKREGRGWGIQSRVKAHGSGSVGDIITVEDTANKRKYPARIAGPGTVEVVVKHDSHGIVVKDDRR